MAAGGILAATAKSDDNAHNGVCNHLLVLLPILLFASFIHGQGFSIRYNNCIFTGPPLMYTLDHTSILGKSMDAKLAFSLVKLIQAGVRGDGATVAEYARQMSDHLATNGDAEASDRIRHVLNGRSAKKASIERVASPIPVDTESRLAVADEIIATEPVEIALPDEARLTVERFLSCVMNAHRLVANGVTAPTSMLMYGPPGCGKTLLAYHIAQRLELPLLVARSDSLISSYLGSTAKNIRSLFEHAASRRCILFLDEFDALAKMRDDQHELGELKRVVISLLQNIDANGADCLLLAATNHQHLLDPAVWRRFSYTIQIPLPDCSARLGMITSFFGTLVSEETAESIAVITDGLSGAQLRSIADDAIRDAVLSSRDQIDLRTALPIVLPRLNGTGPHSLEETVRMLKTKLGKSMSQARLGESLGVSQATISRILKPEDHDG
jgi:hypothetical protein